MRVLPLLGATAPRLAWLKSYSSFIFAVKPRDDPALFIMIIVLICVSEADPMVLEFGYVLCFVILNFE